ncbi:MAG: hypothetical protein ABJB16_08330 [Saprospiraceae bacterium]
MDVHHHSPRHTRKNWKAYFWEFLMLFLAVFCGFLAEYKLEHVIEHQRAKVFAASMIDDLMVDTTQLNTYIKQVSYDAHNIDTLFQLLADDDLKAIPTGKLYWYGLFGGAQRSFLPNDATLQQMKYSGSIRYFQNKTIGRQVARYDQLCRNIVERQQSDMMLFTEVRKLRGLIFEARYNQQANLIFSKSRFLTDKQMVDSFIMTHPPLLTNDKIVFNQYVEMIRSRKMTNLEDAADSLLQTASVLIINLRKEYHL